MVVSQFISMSTQYLSSDGLQKIKDELKELKTVKRPIVIERIEAALALGDLSENAEYHEAKENLALIEGRVFELEQILKDVSMIEQGHSSDGIVHLGSKVKVRVNGKDKELCLVGTNEAAPLAGKISNASPLGQSLMGMRAGERVDVQTPNGTTTYEVIAVE